MPASSSRDDETPRLPPQGAERVGEPPSDERIRRVGSAADPPAPLPRIYVAQAAWTFVEDRLRRAQGSAAAGLLLGQPWRTPSGESFLIVDGVVEAPDVELTSRSVKFPPAAWRSLQAAAREVAGREVVGWFHGRPGEPLELSPYEQFVHQTQFGAPWQVALVLDPGQGGTGPEGITAGRWWAWNTDRLDPVPGFFLMPGARATVITAADQERHGLWGAQQAAATREPTAAAGPAGAWRRGTWPVSRAQQMMTSRAQPGRTPPGPRSLARMLQAATLLVLVFVTAMMARWGIERAWPGWLSGGGSGDAGQTATQIGRPADGGPVAGAPAERGPSGPVAAGEGEALPAPPAATSEGGGRATGGLDVMGGGPGVRPGDSRASGPSPAGEGVQPAKPGAPVTARDVQGQGQGPGDGGGSGPAAYVVAAGDNLWAISQRFYGDPAHYRWLAEINGIPDPSHILPGQRLVIPPVPGGPAPGRK